MSQTPVFFDCGGALRAAGRHHLRCVLIATTLLSLVSAHAAHGQTNVWLYKRAVTVANVSGSTLANYEARITLDVTFDFTKARSDGSDLIVKASDGITPLPFWIEYWDAGLRRAVIWVRIPSLPVLGTTVFLHYGNASAVPASNGPATLDSYDGFEGLATGAPPSPPENPGQWARYAGNPVLAPGAPGTWDQAGATFGSVIWDATAGEFRLYYHGIRTDADQQIGLATSPDGINWTKYPGNPIVRPTPGEWDFAQTRVPMVWKEGPTDYRMIYTGAGMFQGAVGYATSTDGINWTKRPGFVFNDPTWANGQTENWGVIKVGSQYLMWYSSWGRRESGIAVSSDLINWVPYQAAPIFKSSGIPTDDRYSQFCAFTFTYGGKYYVMMPSYDRASNYASLYLYRSSSPYFPESDRQLVRVAHTVGAPGQWDSFDSDTPAVLTLDIQRSQFYNNELWVYYAGANSSAFAEGLLIEQNIAAAVADKPMPKHGWTATGLVAAVDAPARGGARALHLSDVSDTDVVTATREFPKLARGTVGLWMRGDSFAGGSYDVYLYERHQLIAMGGLGTSGGFHYWDGTMHETGVGWNLGKWYFVSFKFNVATGTYTFSVLDDTLASVINIPNIALGYSTDGITKAMLYGSILYKGSAYADDFRASKWIGDEVTIVVGAEQLNATAPAAFSKTAPINLASAQPLTLALSWAASAGATSYQHCVDTSNDGVCAGSWISTTALSATKTGLQAATTYYWQVRAVNSAGTTNANAGTWWRFTTGSLPASFGKSSPLNLDTGQPANLTLDWGGSSGATSYEYCYDTSNDSSCSNWISVTSSSAAVTGLSGSTTYYWQVRAVNATGTTVANSGTWWRFTTGSLPATFGKISPSNAATGQPGSLTLDWSFSSGATSYQYCYDTSNDSTCSNWISATSSSASVTGLSSSTTYYWQVRAVNDTGATIADSGTWWRFTTGAAPASFAKTSPSNAATGQPVSVTLDWGSSSGATSYQYCYDTSNDSGCSNWISVTSSSAAVTGLSGSTTYYWQVRAINAAGTTVADSGTWWRFTTGTLPASFGKISPLDADTGEPVSVTLDWGSSLGATSYQYCYDTSNDATCSNWISATSSSATVTGLISSTTYYWQVRAVNATGTTLANSGTWWRFTTGAAPAAFAKSSPANGATGQSTSPTLDWSFSSGATRYEYCIDTSNNNACDGSWVARSSSYVTLSSLSRNTTYYWQVRAVSDTGTTYANSTSTWWRFTTLP